MKDVSSGESEKRGKQSQPAAFVLFRRQSKVSKEELSYNEEALRILTFSLSPSKVSSDPRSDISAFCSRWAKSLERGPSERESAEAETGFIDIILSERRQYGVRGVVLAGQPEKQKQYLFILERTSLESAHLEMHFRHTPSQQTGERNRQTAPCWKQQQGNCRFSRTNS